VNHPHPGEEQNSIMNSKGFRMRRDHEAQQELGMPDERLKQTSTPSEQPLAEQQRRANTDPQPDQQPSRLQRLWKSMFG
jgi:hypothetical protein